MTIDKTLNSILSQVLIKDDPYDVVFVKEDIEILTNFMALMSICLKIDLTKEHPMDIYKIFEEIKETHDPASLLIFAALRNNVVKERLVEVCPQLLKGELC